MDEIYGEWAGDDVYAIVITGDFDLALRDRAIAITEQALRQKPKALVVDASRCTFIDSVAIAAIVGARQRALDEGLGFALVSHNPTVDRMIELTGLGSELEIVRDREQALLELRASS